MAVSSGSKTPPSPFYRVTLKALIFDENRKLLVVQSMHRDWEIPGGGWEHDEDFETCLRRELREELGVEPASIGSISFAYKGESHRWGHFTLRLAVPVTLKQHKFTPGDDMMSAKFVDREELRELFMSTDEAPVRECLDQIWPSVEKNAPNL